MRRQNSNRKSKNELFFQQLVKRLSLFKLYERNKYSEGEDEVWQKIQEGIIIQKRAKVKRLVYLVISSAACLLFLLGIANHLIPFASLIDKEIRLADVPVPDIALLKAAPVLRFTEAPLANVSLVAAASLRIVAVPPLITTPPVRLFVMFSEVVCSATEFRINAPVPFRLPDPLKEYPSPSSVIFSSPMFNIPERLIDLFAPDAVNATAFEF